MRLAPATTPVTPRPSETLSPTKQLAPENKVHLTHEPLKTELPLTKQLPGRPADTFASAQSRTTQGNQLHDIAGGVRNGSITEKEAKGLLADQQKIANHQRSAMADGKLSLGERLSLGVEQARASQNIHGAKTNGDRDVFARFDKDAQRQAGQIDQIASGRTRGTITNSEAGHLLGDQSRIAGRRDLAGALNNSLTNHSQNRAQQDITRHSKPGTQVDLHNLPRTLGPGLQKPFVLGPPRVQKPFDLEPRLQKPLTLGPSLQKPLNLEPNTVTPRIQKPFDFGPLPLMAGNVSK
jgi:hypothetical protein